MYIQKIIEKKLLDITKKLQKTRIKKITLQKTLTKNATVPNTRAGVKELVAM